MTKRVGIGFKSTFARLPSGSWQVCLEPLDARAREILPDQPIVGYGRTRDEAREEASLAAIRNLNKLSDKDRESLRTTAIPEDVSPVGGYCDIEAVADEHFGLFSGNDDEPPGD